MESPNRWVIPPPKKNIVVGVADMVASNDAGADIVTYSLGSCLGIVIYDPVLKLGGLLHVMLPDSTIDANKARTAPYMFVDTGVPRLFHAVYNLGGEKHRLHVKVAGGAQFMDDNRFFNIGQRNQLALVSLLQRNGIQIHKQAVGGNSSRTLRLELGSGNVSIHSPGEPPYAL
jgi:chemotaxis protein CheD